MLACTSLEHESPSLPDQRAKPPSRPISLTTPEWEESHQELTCDFTQRAAAIAWLSVDHAEYGQSRIGLPVEVVRSTSCHATETPTPERHVSEVDTAIRVCASAPSLVVSLVSSTDESSLVTFGTGTDVPCISWRKTLRAVFTSCQPHPEGTVRMLKFQAAACWLCHVVTKLPCGPITTVIPRLCSKLPQWPGHVGDLEIGIHRYSITSVFNLSPGRGSQSRVPRTVCDRDLRRISERTCRNRTSVS